MPTYGQYDVPTSDTMVNFGVGQPDNKKLPLDLVKSAFKKFIDEIDNPEILQYGDIPGYKRFREKLAKWLTEKNYNNVTEEFKNNFIDNNEIFITNGVTHALHLIMTCFINQEDTIFVEDPTYFIMINIFKEFGLDVVPIPMENDGINLVELESKIEKLCRSQDKVFLYTIPINHNPSGITMSHEKRILLATLCDTYPNFYILADEVYHFLSWKSFTPENQVLPLADYHPNIISINSFAKILAPSLRLGWVYQNLKFEDINTNFIDGLKSCGLYDSTGGTGVISSFVTEHLIENGKLDEYIEECKSFLGSRCRTICNELQPLKEAKQVEFEEPIGGYFVWVKVNDIDVDELLDESVPNKVKFHPGWKFTAGKDKFKNYLRLSCSFYDEEGIKVGIERLSDTILNFSKTKVSVLGASGKLGSLIVDQIKKNTELSYSGPIGRDFNTSHIVEKNNVIIDVSLPEATNNLLKILISKNLYVPLIIGTTGDLNMELINGYSKKAPVAIISNFSDGVPTVIEFSKILNNLSDDWKCEMVEKHHVNKKDSPSGTAKSWVDSLNRDCNVESVREGEVFGEHKLRLTNGKEEIIIEHRAKNRDIFAEGSIKYIDWIQSLRPGLYHKIDYSKYNRVRTRTYSASGNILMVVEFLEYKKWKPFVLKMARENKKLDGVIFLERYENNNLEMETKWTYFNRDGSNVQFCGNGVRCIGKYLSENYKELTGEIFNGSSIRSTYKKTEDNMIFFNSPKPIMVKSGSQVKKIHELTQQFEFLNVKEIALIAVGVAHIVICCECDIFEIDNSIIEYISKTIHDTVSYNFNVNFISVIDDDNFKIRTYERGVNAETGSCGSGTIASFYFLNELGRVNDSCYSNYLNDGKMMVYISGDEINKKYHLGGDVKEIEL